jgi:hypothetical protein
MLAKDNSSISQPIICANSKKINFYILQWNHLNWVIFVLLILI